MGSDNPTSHYGRSQASVLRLALRAGLTGAVLGLVHAGILARVGLFAESDSTVIAIGVTRYVAGFFLVAVVLGVVSGVVARLLRWRSLPMRRGLIFLYLLVWAAFLFKQSSGRGVGGVGLAVVVALLAAATMATRLRWKSSPAARGGWVGTAGLVVLIGISSLAIFGPWMPAIDGDDASEVPLQGGRLEAERSAARDAFAPGGWNVLLLSFDTLRADHLGAYGYARATSASLDSLAASGVRFDNAIVQRPKTSPNVATILTGTYPARHGVHQVMHALPEFNRTLAEILSDAGWHTGAVITNGNLYPEFQFDQGFEAYEYGHKNAREGADKALAWLDERGSAQPWLLWVHATDPHWPYDPPEPWRSRLAQSGVDAHQDAIDRYDGEIAFTDHETGRILAWLHRHPEIADRTLVVFTADHGESLGEHDYSFEHGLLPYEPSARVPLLISFPGRVPTGQVREPVVGSVDILPTILDALQVPVPPTVQGESLLPLVLGLRDESPRGFAFLEAGYGEHIGPGRTRALRTRTHKYVRRLKEWAIAPRLGNLVWTFDSALEGGLAADECYDLVADPEEIHSLGFDRALRDSVDAIHRELARQAQEDGAREPGDLDEKTEASLRSLGYLD